MNEINVVETPEKAKKSSKSCYGSKMFEHSTVGLNISYINTRNSI